MEPIAGVRDVECRRCHEENEVQDMTRRSNSRTTSSLLSLLLLWTVAGPLRAADTVDDRTLRVFIFAGQSNMVGSDSKVKDIKRFPPFVGLEQRIHARG